MTVETVQSEHGSRDHIINPDPDKGSINGIVTYCGHTHFEGPTEEYETSKRGDLCGNCIEQLINEVLK